MSNSKFNIMAEKAYESIYGDSIREVMTAEENRPPTNLEFKMRLKDEYDGYVYTVEESNTGFMIQSGKGLN
jgi:hypothetical protein